MKHFKKISTFIVCLALIVTITIPVKANAKVLCNGDPPLPILCGGDPPLPIAND